MSWDLIRISWSLRCTSFSCPCWLLICLPRGVSICIRPSRVDRSRLGVGSGSGCYGWTGFATGYVTRSCLAASGSGVVYWGSRSGIDVWKVAVTGSWIVCEVKVIGSISNDAAVDHGVRLALLVVYVRVDDAYEWSDVPDTEIFCQCTLRMVLR
jgi:hypothetical protein